MVSKLDDVTPITDDKYRPHDLIHSSNENVCTWNTKHLRDTRFDIMAAAKGPVAVVSASEDGWTTNVLGMTQLPDVLKRRDRERNILRLEARPLPCCYSTGIPDSFCSD